MKTIIIVLIIAALSGCSTSEPRPLIPSNDCFVDKSWGDECYKIVPIPPLDLE